MRCQMPSETVLAKKNNDPRLKTTKKNYAVAVARSMHETRVVVNKPDVFYCGGEICFVISSKIVAPFLGLGVFVLRQLIEFLWNTPNYVNGWVNGRFQLGGKKV